MAVDPATDSYGREAVNPLATAGALALAGKPRATEVQPQPRRRGSSGRTHVGPAHHRSATQPLDPNVTSRGVGRQRSPAMTASPWALS